MLKNQLLGKMLGHIEKSMLMNAKGNQGNTFLECSILFGVLVSWFPCTYVAHQKHLLSIP